MEELEVFQIRKDSAALRSHLLHAARAFCGPEVLHVDLTNHCNFDCIACWCRSPLLKDKAMPEWEKKLSLPLDIIKGVFDDLQEMGGLRQVKLVGGGEPFMHPDILDIVSYIKKKNRSVQIDINTNFSLVDERIVDKFLDLEVESLTVSVWAGSPDIYTAIHPNQTQKTFLKIKNMLKFLSERKRERGLARPRVILHEVIFNLNYLDVQSMVDFALEVGAQDIQFVPMDPFKDRTESLLLADGQRRELLKKLRELKKSYDETTLRYMDDAGRIVSLPDFSGFLRRMEKLDTDTGAYDEEAVEEVPCYAGWLFARLMATGDVVPCCKGHRMPMGNIFENRFKDIWFSKAYNEFRYKGMNFPKSHSYFSKMGNDAVARTGCYNCDNLWQNIPIHNAMKKIRIKNPKIAGFYIAFLKRWLGA